MGVYTIKRKSGTTVCINYVVKGHGQQRETIERVDAGGKDFASRLREAKARARDVLVKRRAAIVEERFELPRSRRSMTLAKFVADTYKADMKDRGLRSFDMEVQRLTTGPVAEFFGPLLLAQIDQWTVRKYVKGRREGTIGRKVGAATINRDLARLSNLWNVAAREKLVTGVSPFREVGKLKEPRGRVRYLTDAEEQALLGALRADVRVVAELALHTGIRQGALLALQWRHVRFGEGLIDVPEELDKTGKGYRVAMNRRVVELLRELSKRGAFTGPDDIVLCRRDGSKRLSVRTAFERARGRRHRRLPLARPSAHCGEPDRPGRRDAAGRRRAPRAPYTHDDHALRTPEPGAEAADGRPDAARRAVGYHASITRGLEWRRCRRGQLAGFVEFTPGWWNGRHARLRIWCRKA